MKAVFVAGGMVTSIIAIPDNFVASVNYTAPSGSQEYSVPDNSDVQVGYTCTVTAGVPAFTAGYVSNYVSGMKFKLFFTTKEYNAIYASTDAGTVNFRNFVDQLIAAGESLDLNLPIVQAKVNNLQSVTASSDGALPLSVARCTAILSGTLATS